MSDNSNRLAGAAYLSIDGQTYLLRGGFSYDSGLVSRTTLTGMDKVHGYSEKPKPPHMAATLTDSNGLSLAALNAMTNVTLVCELANGKTIIGRNMWAVDDQEAKSEDATIEVKWEGQQGAVTEI